MTRFDPGDIVLVEFPFSHLQGQKRRPGLVLVSDDADVVLARITTQSQRVPSDVPLVHWSTVGLPRPSTVRLTKLATIDTRLVHRRLGTLHREDSREIAKGVKLLSSSVVSRLQSAAADRTSERVAGQVMKFELFTQVSLNTDLPEHGLRPGDLATVVEYHLPLPNQEPRYSLEVLNAVGDSMAVVVVLESEIIPLNAKGLLHVRPLAEPIR